MPLGCGREKERKGIKIATSPSFWSEYGSPEITTI